jgi:APA family basic amino acid/polyamine antiporter
MALKLRRSLTLFEATFYGIGIIVGAGIYALIGEAAGAAGNSLWMSFLIGAAISGFTGLSYAELAAMFPSDAAEYVYVRKAYHSKFLGFILSWLIIFTGILSASTVALGFAGYFNSIFSSYFNFPLILTAIVLLIFLSFVNFYGIKESSKMNIVFSSIEVLGLIIVIALALASRNFANVNYFEMPNGFKGIFSASILVFFAYIGFEEVVHISEETKNPKKFIPKAILLAIAVTTILYLLVSVSVITLTPWNTLSVPNPLAFAASKSILGSHANFLISVIALFATLGTILIILVGTSRMIYGVAKERALPSILSKIHKKRKTPWIAVAVAGIFSILFLFFGNIDTIASITSLGAFITFAATNLSLIWLRYTRPKIPRPFKVPLSIGKFPVLPAIGVAICIFMIYQFQLIEIAIGIAIILLGIFVYHLRKNKIILAD